MALTPYLAPTGTYRTYWSLSIYSLESVFLFTIVLCWQTMGQQLDQEMKDSILFLSTQPQTLAKTKSHNLELARQDLARVASQMSVLYLAVAFLCLTMAVWPLGPR